MTSWYPILVMYFNLPSNLSVYIIFVRLRVILYFYFTVSLIWDKFLEYIFRQNSTSKALENKHFILPTKNMNYLVVSLLSDNWPFLNFRGLKPNRLPFPWISGKNTEWNAHFLFQGIFPDQRDQSCVSCLGTDSLLLFYQEVQLPRYFTVKLIPLLIVVCCEEKVKIKCVKHIFDPSHECHAIT